MAAEAEMESLLNPKESGEDKETVLVEAEATRDVHMLDYWYPVLFLRDFPNDRPVPAQVWGEPLVIFRGKDNEIVCLQDRCAHRSAPLSIGTWKDGGVECRYHGWVFSNEGKCIRVPSFPETEPIPKSIRVPSYPAVEREGMIWVWLGDPSKCDKNLGFPEKAWEIESKDFLVVDQVVDLDYSYWSAIENLLDPAHLQYTHEGQQGKNIGSTDGTFVELHEFVMSDTLNKGGFKGLITTTQTAKPLKFSIAFDPPVTVRLEVTFPNGWRFHQMHYCVPLTEGKTKMFFRSMRDWLKFIPESSFVESNNRVLIQDKLVLNAQKLRLDQGASRWNYPVKGDALAIRYRRWRDLVEPRSKPWFKGYLGSSFKKGGGVRRGAADLEKTGSKDKDAAVKEIEDLPNCCGACDNNMPVIEDINKQAPAVWPSSKQFKEPVSALTILKALGNSLFYAGYLFAIAVAIYTLAKNN